MNTSEEMSQSARTTSSALSLLLGLSNGPKPTDLSFQGSFSILYVYIILEFSEKVKFSNWWATRESNSVYTLIRRALNTVENMADIWSEWWDMYKLWHYPSARRGRICTGGLGMVRFELTSSCSQGTPSTTGLHPDKLAPGTTLKVTPSYLGFNSASKLP